MGSLSSPQFYLEQIDLVPSSSHHLISSPVAEETEGTLLGQSACVLCGPRLLKPINVASEKL